MQIANSSNKFIWFILALYPVFEVYAFIKGISFGLFVLILIFPLSYFLNKKMFGDINLIIFAIITFFLHTISFVYCAQNYGVESLYWNNLFSITVFFVLLSHFTSIKVHPIYFSTTIFIAVLATFAIYIQVITFYCNGYIMNFFLPLDLRDRVLDQLSVNRPYSFFLEPSQYASFILPVFYYSIIKNRFVLSLFLASGLFLSMSSNGIVVGVLIFLYSIYTNKKYKISFKYFILFAVCLYTFSFFFNFDKVLELGQDKFVNANDNSRLLGSLPILFLMNFKQLLFGLSIGQLENFLFFNHFYFVEKYANAFLLSIFNCGILGLLAYLWYLFRAISKCAYKGCIVIVILLSFSTALLYSPDLFFLLLFSYALNSLERRN